ncbi:MAG: BlaI/MecI/CopY family transcriptional regulator [Clostridia bacterium]|nr:BlaI/MecI/CopY family transcriptional regulator [Clostridia bacterium]MBR2878041.1 BlaI/MecI/CopY family transcriptional regulator [Clostridia bacterium]MBR6645901.1 BlaI/MecI/CopY family transcriptional regulator [Clostridia bacterium]
MEHLKLCASDYRFMTIVWENEPIQSGNLVKICLEELGWKKSTTYTMVKKLSEKGYLRNENSVVKALIPKEDVQAFESEYVVNNTFEGSLPAFIAAFMSNKKLTEKEAEEIKRLIEHNTEE